MCVVQFRAGHAPRLQPRFGLILGESCGGNVDEQTRMYAREYFIGSILNSPDNSYVFQLFRVSAL